MYRRRIRTSINNIIRALDAKELNVIEPGYIEDMYVRVGAMDVNSFATNKKTDFPYKQSVIIVGNRWDIQQKSITIGARLVVVTGDYMPADDTLERAKEAGVSFILTRHDSATTAWLMRTSVVIEGLIEKNVPTVHSDTRISELKMKINNSNMPSFVVVNDDHKFCGLLHKVDLLKPPKTKLVLVDHNEMTQAVPGAEHVDILEIIDHHRLGALSTHAPILFINEPVGSTCTIVADMYRREHMTPTSQIAGLLASGIISDTLNLNSPTSTLKDSDILSWLLPIANITREELSALIFNTGSMIKSGPPNKVIRIDIKVCI